MIIHNPIPPFPSQHQVQVETLLEKPSPPAGSARSSIPQRLWLLLQTDPAGATAANMGHNSPS